MDGDEPIFLLRDDRSDSEKELERRRAALHAVSILMRADADNDEIGMCLMALGLKDYTPPPRKKRRH